MIKMVRNILARPSRRAVPAPRLALCERVTATGTSPHHIRELSERGMLTSGGADTLALCGAKVAWDTSELVLTQLPQIIKNGHASFHICVECAAAASPAPTS